MADRLTVDEFFEALRVQNITPLVDTPAVRRSVTDQVRFLCIGYPVQDRWPVLDLESAYEKTLNYSPNVLDLVRDGYFGTVKLRGFDNTYTLDEWFDDFRKQWVLTDRSRIRATMLAQLPASGTWKSPELWDAYQRATRLSLGSWLRRLTGR